MKIPIRLPPRIGRPVDVVGFGENSIDLVAVVPRHPDRNSKVAVRDWQELPGGQIASAMAACARLGCRTRYVGRFGNDARGDVGLQSLEREGVDTAFSQRVPGVASRACVILVDERNGERTVVFHRDPRLALPPAALPADAIRDGRVLLVDATDLAAATRAADIARESGIPVIADVDTVVPGIDALLSGVDIVIAAEAFPAAFIGVGDTGAALNALAAALPRAAVVCVTLGKEGSLARCDDREVRTPGFTVECLDSTGAGDVFRAGFVAAWVRGGDTAELEDVLRYANAAAALSCRGLGARSAPFASDVERILA